MAVADYLAGLHTCLTGHSSISQTPLEFLRNEARMERSSIWLLSAGGRNVDILRSMRRAIEVEPAHLAALCGAHGSPLAKLAAGLAIDVFEHAPPAGKDGFLATNSLASFLLLLARAYSEITNSPFPSSLEELTERSTPGYSGREYLREKFGPILEREHWLVLYDPGCRPIATDLESRFSEAALGSIKLADIRNFAHGRHHWIAKRSSTSAVVILSQPGTQNIANKSLQLLPPSIPRTHISFSCDPILAPIAGIMLSMEIADWAGKTRGIDPGKPGVPEFGRRFYNLTTKPRGDSELASEQFVRRKARLTTKSLRGSTVGEVWDKALHRFCDELGRNSIRAIVFDYDGTLVDVQHRFEPPKQDVSLALVELLSAGVRIGIATGRGKSVRRDLQKVIPKEFWPHILIGYYNGAELGRLHEDGVPDSAKAQEPVIVAALELLNRHAAIRKHIRLDESHSQISVQWESTILGWKLLDLLDPVLHALRQLGINVVSSGHSIDLLAPGVSKLRVVSKLSRDECIPLEEILAIGDRGRAPGNDAELLSHGPALSVDEVSDDPSTCWRLTPPMLKGTGATIWYLSRLSARKRVSGSVFFKKGALKA